MSIPAAVDFRVIDVDEDYTLVEFSAGDGAFAGSTQLYGGRSEASALAQGLAGFPTRIGEERQIELGSRDPKVADGWVHIRCLCDGRTGHVLLEIHIMDKAVRAAVPGREVRLQFPTRPAALDEFAAALNVLDWRLGNSATLRSDV